MKLKKSVLALSTATAVTISGIAVAGTEEMKSVTTNHNDKGDKGSSSDIAPEEPRRPEVSFHLIGGACATAEAPR
ncbi:hypothetical protein [Corynebacterium lactis]|uniref:Uncharacterized protein n=1 Tax=Corynebacterium lactis RW2-5 TaxID=1408189 RepID=A0A0K2H2V9_9CORY|nr:hypothetical protein [Corynebacterium lactis]ALA68385.1 hypothetical protein CLAC_01780 [Corynebacterium lactis RW2-5]